MSNQNLPYLSLYSQRSIEDQFIDDCLQFDIFSTKNDKMQTGIKIESHQSIYLNQFGSEKSFGRWTIQESLIYLETIKVHNQTKSIIKDLSQRLPQRIDSQIRAHHQKMLKKYGSIKEIIRCLDRKQNPHLLQINQHLQVIEQKLSKLSNQNDPPSFH